MVPESPPTDLTEELEGWIKADGDLHSGIWPSQSELRLWYKITDQPSKRQDMNYNLEPPITEVDILYGDDQPFYGFERVTGGKVTAAKEHRWSSVDITYRRGNPGESDLMKHAAPETCAHSTSRGSKGAYASLQFRRTL